MPPPRGPIRDDILYMHYIHTIHAVYILNAFMTALNVLTIDALYAFMNKIWCCGWVVSALNLLVYGGYLFLVFNKI